jgi:TonB family protein
MGDGDPVHACLYHDCFAVRGAIGLFASRRSDRAPDKDPHVHRPDGRETVRGPSSRFYQPDPPYSKKAREKKLQGQVWLSIIVGTDGTTRDVKVSKSLGLGLDEEAVKAVQTWKFNPATLEGTPVAVHLVVSVDFHLL